MFRRGLHNNSKSSRNDDHIAGCLNMENISIALLGNRGLILYNNLRALRYLQVDCFSFGMFIYELLTLHQPFENHESVKECILEGGRPSFTRKVTILA